MNVGIYIYDGVDVLDFAGPYEVFSTASRVFGLQSEAPAPFSVSLLAEARRPVEARGKLVVQPHFDLGDHPPLDVLVVPGGTYAGELEKPRVIDWIAQQYAQARLVASVCTGAFLLARAGLLAGLEVTTHWEDCADLARSFPALRVRGDVRWTEHERVMTSAGISAGIDMSLRVVSRLAGEMLAVRTARQLDYDWRKRA